MENSNLEEYVEVLEIFINHFNSGDKELLAHSKIRDTFGLGETQTKYYEQRKRSYDRCMEFYSLIRLINIQTDTTKNEFDRLNRIRKKHSYKITNPITKEKSIISIPLEERKQLDPYIQYIKSEQKSNTFKDECKLYNKVGRFRKPIEVWVDGNNDEVDIDILKKLPKYIHPHTDIGYSKKDTDKEKSEKQRKLKENQLNPLRDYPTDKNGFNVVSDKLKFKKVKKERLTYEFFGDKFQNLTTDMMLDFTDKNGDIRSLSDDSVTIDNETIGIVDFENNNVRVLDCLYRLNTNDKCIENNPIEYNLPSDSKIDMFVDFLMRNIDKKFTDDGVYEEDLTSPLVSTIINSNAFGDNKGFVSQTIGKLIVFNHNNMNTNNKTEGYYPLDVLIQIIESENSIDIEFENFGNTLKLQNTKIKKIVVGENYFDLHFENFISQNHTDISQIKKIDNHSEDGLRSDVDKVIKIIDGLDEKNKEYYKKEFDVLTSSFDMFIF